MEENLKWLWAAFSIAWILHLAYVALLSARTRKLERQIETLNSQVQSDRHPQN